MNIKRFQFNVSVLGLCLLLTSCLDEFQGDRVLVVSEEILEVSAEDVSFLGRLTTSTEAPQETGYYLSTDEAFSNPTILQSVNEPGIGAFVVNFDGLVTDTEYFARAYASVGGEVFFGEVLNFRAKSPSILSFSPSNAPIGNQVIISGLNFTRDTRVFFGDIEAEILGIELRSEITVVVPEVGNERDVNINISAGGVELSSENLFTYHTGVWTKVGEYPNTRQVVGAVAIHGNDQLILGYGNSVAENSLNDLFFSLNKESFQWSSIAAPPGTVPVEDPINLSNGYLSGTSFFGFLTLVQPRDSWEYDFDNNSWLFSGSIPFGLSQGLSARLGDVDYVFGGLNGDTTPNSFIWKRDEDGNWTQIGTSPFGVTSNQAHFIYDGKFCYQLNGNEIWSFDPESEEWSPFLVFENYRGMNNLAVVLGDKLFLGLGDLGQVLFEIDLVDGGIIEKNLFPGIPGEQNITQWVFNDKIYLIRTALTAQARITGVDRTEIWELDPDALK